MADLVAGCKNCNEFRGKSVEMVINDLKEAVPNIRRVGPEELSGQVKVHLDDAADSEIEVTWVVTNSRSKCLDPEKGEGEHLIFTTFDYHLGEEEKKARIELAPVALKVAYNLAAFMFPGEKTGVRVVLNTGDLAASNDHCHFQLIIVREKGRLPRAVANILQVFDNVQVKHNLSKEAIEDLDQGIMQQKRKG